jgi:hypothetical protein
MVHNPNKESIMFNQITVILFRTLIAICVVGLLTSAHATEGKPVAVVENDSYDFGFKFEGLDVIHDYIIKNTGDADLEILTVKAG